MNNTLTVMIVDDNRTNLRLMDMLVRKLPNCATLLYSDSPTVVAELGSINFDIAIIDYQMPNLNGVDLTRTIRSHTNLADKPIVMVTVDHDTETKMAALEAGVVEFLHKPIEPVEFRTRIRNLARLSEVQRNLSAQSDWLKSEVEKATAELRWREEEIVNRLSRAAGYKDQETALHTFRVARYAGLLARCLGLPQETCRDIQIAAPMHDIGKVGIRDEVLLKKGFLTEQERLHVNEHTRIGGAILAGSECSLLKLAADIARTHHERWDGMGYPAGLKKGEIPIAGRILAVADVFDALTTARPFKTAWSLNHTLDYLIEESGRQFDPDCVIAFTSARDEIASIMSTTTERIDAA